MRTSSPTAGLLAASAAAALLACGSDPTPEARPVPEVDGASPSLLDTALSPRNANYQIAATYDAEKKRIAASMTLEWTHRGRTPVTELPFHLYMNAFKNDGTVFWRESRGRHRSARATEDGWGEIAVTAVGISSAAEPGTEVGAASPFDLDRIELPGPDETVMVLPLDAPMAPGATIRVTMEFRVILPEVFARTGYKGDFAMVGQWFPKIGVRAPGPDGEERWFCEPFHRNSEFFADFGTYDVELTVPNTHLVAATGVLVEAEAGDNETHRLRYRAADVHDFAWMADPHMKVIKAPATTERGEVEVHVYFRDPQRDFAKRHLDAGVGSIEAFSRHYVPYPWPIMSIIDPPPDAMGGAGGMEYPTLVTTAADTAITGAGVRFPEFVTVHEVGHNWFQGILASNEVEEAWLDEGVNEYADALVMLELYGPSATLDAWGFRADPFAFRLAAGMPLSNLPDPIATRSFDFADSNAYGSATYAKTALALRTLENLVGAEAFATAMKSYAQRRAFTHPTGKELFADLERSLGVDIDWFVQPAFYGRGTVKLVVRGVHCHDVKPLEGLDNAATGKSDGARVIAVPDGKKSCELVVANVGDIPIPFDAELVLEDGSRRRETFDGSSSSHRRELALPSAISTVVLDPDNRILLNEGGLESIYRADSDGSASMRVGAGFHALTQVLLQGAGL